VKPYRFVSEAAAEFHDHIRYFDEQDPDLGDRFIERVNAVIRDIRRYPESGALMAGNVRKRVVRVFPYNVLYVDRPEEIIIVAVAPHKRRPGYWRKRLRSLR
jgi:toxin ParE1/3/4